MGKSVFVLWLAGVEPESLSQVPALAELSAAGVDVQLEPLPLVEKGVSYYQTLTGSGSGQFGRFDAVYPVEYEPRAEPETCDDASSMLLPHILQGRGLSATYLEMDDTRSLATFQYQAAECTIVRVLNAGGTDLAAVVERVLHDVPSDATKVVLTDVRQDPAARQVNSNDFLADIGLLEVGQHRSRAAIDWSETLAYGIGSGQVWVNLRGREAQGIVGAGKEYQEVIAALREQLTQWRDPQTRELIVKDIQLKEEAYAGTYLFKAPDLVILFNPGYAASQKAMMLDFDEESVSGTPPATAPAAATARLIAAGPQLKRGYVDQGALIDVAPTLLYLLDQPVPRFVEGNVLASLILPRYLQRNEIRRSEDDDLLSGNEEEVIVDRLRDLGYLD